MTVCQSTGPRAAGKFELTNCSVQFHTLTLADCHWLNFHIISEVIVGSLPWKDTVMCSNLEEVYLTESALAD